jgi:large subunit ribosomal protein L21
MYAIIKTAGKQYKVTEGQILDLDKMSLEPKEKVTFDKVLFTDKKIGTPFIDGAKVEAEVIVEGKDRKVVIFKSRRRKDSKLKKGFRRQYTRVRITKISA